MFLDSMARRSGIVRGRSWSRRSVRAPTPRLDGPTNGQIVFQMSFKVFISHGTPDRWVAGQLRKCIHDCGGSAFLDEHDVPKGDDFERRIFEELAACHELLVLFTAQSYQRPWLWMEIGAARSQLKRIVAVLYGIDVGALEKIGGGNSTIFKGINIVDLNEVALYFEQLRLRIGAHDVG